MDIESDTASESMESDVVEEDQDVSMSDASSSAEESEVDQEIEENKDSASDKSESDDEEEKPEISLSQAKALEIPRFDWTGADDESSQESEDESMEPATIPKSKRAKKREKREQEDRVARKELELLQGDQAPETADDFERLLLGSPNNSFLWIKYMAFQIQMTEVEKAREVAERALKTINFRDSQEKLNIWVAFLNLENTYGSVESLLKVFVRAVCYNEPKKVYIHLARIYERTDKIDSADQLYQVMIKKFKGSSKIWTGYGLFLLKHNKPEEARALLQKCVKVLPSHKRKLLKEDNVYRFKNDFSICYHGI
jgi:rRNA biogenesis protein RRP5